MYLFIFESIGTSELVLIGLVALIFFGPRKLPDLARTFGKAMNEFRRSTNDFKQAWEKEVASEIHQIKNDVNFTSLAENPNGAANTIEKNTLAVNKQITIPEIREVSQEDFQGILPKENLQTKEQTEPANNLSSKQNWL
ncbi:MAG TPA: twin-arginine translocase TatA/TatE family subunit [Pyrinomonadaceae bacterium]|jgi:Tat protein translocase TatB subunit